MLFMQHNEYRGQYNTLIEHWFDTNQKVFGKMCLLGNLKKKNIIGDSTVSGQLQSD